MNKDDVKRVNFAISSIKRRAMIYSSLRMYDANTKSSFKSLIHASAPSKKLGKIGVALICIPEPTPITSAIGLGMIGTGKLLERYYTGLTLKHVGEETQRTLDKMQEYMKLK